MEGTAWHVYMIRCRGGALYTGIATDVPRRLAEHVSGGPRAARFLRGRGPLEVVLDRSVGERGLALRLESRIKRLPKAGKETLVARPNLLEELIRPLREPSPDEGESSP